MDIGVERVTLRIRQLCDKFGQDAARLQPLYRLGASLCEKTRLEFLEDIADAIGVVPLALYDAKTFGLILAGKAGPDRQRIKQYVCQAIEERFASEDVTVSEVADAINISPAAISAIRHGKNLPALSTLEAMASHIGLVPAYLVERPVPEMLESAPMASEDPGPARPTAGYWTLTGSTLPYAFVKRQQ